MYESAQAAAGDSPEGSVGSDDNKDKDSDTIEGEVVDPDTKDSDKKE
jgi:hypothetical protein